MIKTDGIDVGEAIKELQKKVEELSQEDADLSYRVVCLESTVKDLEMDKYQ